MSPSVSGPLNIFAGDSLQLSIRRNDLDLSSEGDGGCTNAFDTPDHYVWHSSNTQVATVSGAGLVRAVTPGTATISANGLESPYFHTVPAQLLVLVTTR